MHGSDSDLRRVPATYIAATPSPWAADDDNDDDIGADA